MILMEIFSYVIDALLIYVFYDKYFSKDCPTPSLSK